MPNIALGSIRLKATRVIVLTLGNTQEATNDSWDECFDEVYAILRPQAKSSSISHN